jgi:hypothetical protein
VEAKKKEFLGINEKRESNHTFNKQLDRMKKKQGDTMEEAKIEREEKEKAIEALRIKKLKRS